MKYLLKWLDRLSNALDSLDRSRREAWLAQSADVYELESRIRDLERHAVHGSF